LIAAGQNHTCVLLPTGGVKCWGLNSNGQLGNGNYANSNIPVPVTGLSGSTVIAIACGNEHTCAVLSDGTVKCWGINDAGQLGDGSNTTSNIPVNVTGLGGTVTAIAAGSRHTCVIMSDKSAKCWGRNVEGQLGSGNNTASKSPVPVTSIAANIIAIAAGGDHTCALLGTGTVMCWGLNSNGQLGFGHTTNLNYASNVPTLSAISIDAGINHTCAVLSGGTVKCWGYNMYGTLGNGYNADNSNPQDVTALSGVTAIAAGSFHTCALLSNGTVKCWGLNTSGQMGNGSTPPPNSYNTTQNNVTGITTATAIAAGGTHTCAVLSDGTVKCWGDNTYGQLGCGSGTTYFASPQTVGLYSYTLSTGNNNMDYHDVAGGDAITDINTCAVTCSTTPTCRSFLFNASGLGGAYGSKKCAFKDSKVPGNTLAGASFYSLT
jgi:alpha-tubulin suppressor-like RCC1 family protein